MLTCSFQDPKVSIALLTGLLTKPAEGCLEPKVFRHRVHLVIGVEFTLHHQVERGL